MDIKFKREEVKIVKVSPVCDCGGDIVLDNEYGSIAMMSSPPMYYCICESCDKKYRLRSNEITRFEYNI